MSVFPVKLPLYPILNPSDTVQKLLEKDAEDARAWPEKDSKGAAPVRSEAGVAVDQSTRLTAVEGASDTLLTTGLRPGGEQLGAADGQRLDMRS